MAKNKKGGQPQGNKPGKLSFKARPKKKKKQKGAPEQPAPFPRLRAHYEQNVLPELQKKYEIKSTLGTPRITKIVVSMGVGDANDNPRKLEALMDDLEVITGQRPHVNCARLSVANFKLRQGMPVGARVTLRRTRMWEFLDRLLSLVIPRMRDFRGLKNKSFDGRGNYAMGLTDQLVFPEINADRVNFQHGMNIVVCTTARTDEQARELLRLVGFPFRDLPVVVIGGDQKEEE